MSARERATQAAWPRPPLRLRWPMLAEWIVRFVMAATVAVGIVVNAAEVHHGASPAVFVSLIVVGTACLTAWRWTWPTLFLAAAAPVIGALVGTNPIIEWNLAIFATFTLTMRGMSVWLALIPSLSNYGAIVLYAAGLDLGVAAFTYRDAVIAGASTFVFAVIGRSILTTRRYWEQVRLRSKELAEAQEVAVARGVAEERLRIARDLHDVIGHEVAVVNMHLGAAEVHLPADSDASRSDLAEARGGIQHILSETQRMLKILRTQDEPESASSQAPLADYEHIGELIEQCRTAGVEVETTWPSKTPALSVTTSGMQLVIEAVNRQDPSETRPSRTGYGLVGMRERVASVGGTLKTSDEDGLFWVQARLPLAAPAATEREALP